jgi:hypothetical protein
MKGVWQLWSVTFFFFFLVPLTVKFFKPRLTSPYVNLHDFSRIILTEEGLRDT